MRGFTGKTALTIFHTHQRGHLVEFEEAAPCFRALPLLPSVGPFGFLSSFLPCRLVQLLQTETLTRMCLIWRLRGRFIPVLVMKRVAPLRSPMTVYGQPNNALADDKAPAMSVSSLYVRRLASLSSHSHSLSFPLSSSSSAQPITSSSCSLLFFSTEAPLPQLPWSRAFYNHSFPQSESIFLALYYRE